MADQGSRGVIIIKAADASGRQTEIVGDVVQLKDGSYKIQPRENVGSFIHVCASPHVDVYLGENHKWHDFHVEVTIATIVSGTLDSALVSRTSGAVGFAGVVVGVSGQPGALSFDYTESGVFASSTGAVGGTIFVASSTSALFRL